MNWRRGLFRLWIVGSVLFVIAVASDSYSEIKAQSFSGYKCTIKNSLQLKKDGSSQRNPVPDTWGTMEFIIDRASGRMLGGTASGVWKHEVWDRGSDQQSFKAIYTSVAGFLHVQLLQIEEYREGAIKPFLLVDGTNIHTGVCTHLS
jgi:hypothetical protein